MEGALPLVDVGEEDGGFGSSAEPHVGVLEPVDQPVGERIQQTVATTASRPPTGSARTCASSMVNR